MSKFIRIVLVAALAAASSLGFAANENAQIQVQATVPGVCRFTSALSQTMSLTASPAVGGVVSGTAPVTFKCTKNLVYTFSITDTVSTQSDGSLSGTLVAGLETIAYDATWTQPDGTGDGFSAANEVTADVTVSIAEAAYIDKPAGVYQRTLTVNIDY